MKENHLLAKPNDLIAPGPSRNCPNHVYDMVYNYYLEKVRKCKLQKDKEWNGKPSMIDPARLPNTVNGCKPKPRNWQASMSSQVSNKDVHLGEHRKQNLFLKFNDCNVLHAKKCLLQCKSVMNAVLEFLSKLNPRASAQNKDANPIHKHRVTLFYSQKQQRGIDLNVDAYTMQSRNRENLQSVVAENVDI
ncbi:hypothetical protein Tco_0174501 [Tanacetum coccineum]